MKFTVDSALSQSDSLSTVLAAYYELTKPGITFLVLASMAIGFFLGSTNGINYVTLLNAVIGTFLIASGTSAYNQYIERDLDKLMLRTRKRPLPMHRVGPTNAFLFSTFLMLIGLGYLILTVNIVAGFISAMTSILYLGFYTPLKRVSFINVFIGAIPGALPPVGGWAAATGHLDNIGLWILFGIVFLWQIPHVVAIAWLCNDDYERAGFHMLPVKDQNGLWSTVTIMSCLILLIPVSIALYTFHINGMIYLAGAVLSGLVFLLYGIFFMLDRSKLNAKKLMFASLFYLPLVWISILIDRLIA
ncbi:MAG TPA: heme o synthase [Balneolales bacterium]|nr:heme o synthase [Balneolales bacterium]